MTDTIRALLEKAEPDAHYIYIESASHGYAVLDLDEACDDLTNTDAVADKLYTIDTVCAALSASAAVEPVDAPLTDAQVDRMLGARIPGGSAARDWFLPHELPKGLANVRDVVRAMVAAIQRAESAQPKEAEKVCEWCSGTGWLGGPSYSNPGEGGEPCTYCGGKLVEVKP